MVANLVTDNNTQHSRVLESNYVWPLMQHKVIKVIEMSMMCAVGSLWLFIVYMIS